jgi:hypothetical protein
MRNVKPKPVERESEPRGISPDETPHGATAPDFAAPAVASAEIDSDRPAAVTEPGPEILSVSLQRQTDSLEDPWIAFADAQAVLARGWEEIAAEVSRVSRSGIAAAAEAAGALLGATTFSEAVEINRALARRGTDVMIEGSARLAEIGVKAMSEISRPILSRFGARLSGEARHG